MAANEAQKAIRRTALILTVLTAIEFLIAFTWDSAGQALGFSAGTISTMKVLIFILLTIAKAFYIVAEFMHLAGEVRRLIVTVLVPFIFIVWLIIGMMIEGGYYGRITKEEYNTELRVPAPVAPVAEGTQIYG